MKNRNNILLAILFAATLPVWIQYLPPMQQAREAINQPQILTTDEMLGTWTDPKGAVGNSITFSEKGERGYLQSMKVENILGLHNENLSWVSESWDLDKLRQGIQSVSVFSGNMAHPKASSLLYVKALDHNRLRVEVSKDRPELKESPALFSGPQSIELQRVQK